MSLVSVIMPCYLGEYPNCSSNREFKFRRAVASFVDQDYSSKELIIVSDGCDITERIFLEELKGTAPIRLIRIPKQSLFNGRIRQAGVDIAYGKVIAFLDSDDMLGEGHLSSIMRQIGDNDFVYFDDHVLMGYAGSDMTLLRRESSIEHKKIGTTFIAYKKEFSDGVRPSWDECEGYGEDWQFIKKTINSMNESRVAKIFGCMYINCHVPYLKIDN